MMMRFTIPEELSYIKDRPCIIHKQVNAEYLLLLLTDDAGMSKANEIYEKTKELTDEDFAFAAIELTNDECVQLVTEIRGEELSYRPAPGCSPLSNVNCIAPLTENDPQYDVYKSSGDMKLLDEIEMRYIPALKSKLMLYDEVRVILGGHGMAGMFAVWAGMMTDSFFSIAAVSPAPVPKGWAEFTKQHRPMVDYMHVCYSEEEASYARLKGSLDIGDFSVYENGTYKCGIYSVLENMHTYFADERHFKQAKHKGGFNDNVPSAMADGFAWGMGYYGEMMTMGSYLVSYTPRKKNTKVVIPDGISTIGVNAFRRCKDITEVTIPEGVKTIEGQAFSGCTQLKDISIPKSLTKIYANAFTGTKWLDEQPGDFVTVNGTLIKYKGSESEVHVPDDVVSIAAPAFESCDTCEVIYIPESVRSIESGSFDDCKALVEIRVPVMNSELGIPGILRGCPNFQRLIAGETEYTLRGDALCTQDELAAEESEDTMYSEEELLRRQLDSALTGVHETAPDMDEVLAQVSRYLPPQPCIKLGIKHRSTTCYSSKLGGLPYYPKDMEFPKDSRGVPMRLMAQLNFSELPPIPDFPESGILQFFIPNDHDLYGMDMQDLTSQKDFRVVYHKDILGEEQLISMADIPEYDEEYNDFPFKGEYRLVPRAPEVMQPTFSDFRMSEVFLNCYNELSLEGIDEVYDISSDDYNAICKRNGDVGAYIGGYPCFVQEDPRGENSSLTDCDTVLFAMDSVVDEVNDIRILFGDMGTATFLIPRENLKKLDFSRVAYNYDCG